VVASGRPTAGPPVFYYDLGSPECYIVAEQVMTAFEIVPDWQPVLAADLGLAGGEVDRERIEHAAGALNLQPVRWPDRLETDTRQAMLAATYAKRVGRAVAFSLAAFRQTFAGGRDLGEESTVLIAGAACEIHPGALLKGIALRSVREALGLAGQHARRAGVRGLPAIAIDGHVFTGPDALVAAEGLTDERR
jgi:2-hydroxychromene-2-carboxylate isomerase